MKKQLLFKTDIDAIVNNRCKYMILDKNINELDTKKRRKTERTLE